MTMTYEEALRAHHDYYDSEGRTPDEEFLFTEALHTLIDTTKNPGYMCDLAWHYCEQKRFDLELRYLEMAAEYGYGPAYEELGYMWYYGQHGEKDYKKAFEYYSKGAEPDRYGNPGSLWCRYKLADMYRYGCAVEKDEARYCKMIEEAYEEIKNPQQLNDPYPEICLRLAGIRTEQGNTDEAAWLLRNAKRFMAERLSINPFWGHIEVMGRIVRFLYKLTPFDEDLADFYDLFYMTQEPGRYTMMRDRKMIELTVVNDSETDKGSTEAAARLTDTDDTNKERHTAISYDGKWFRNFEEFCQKAKLDGERFTFIYDEIYDVEKAE